MPTIACPSCEKTYKVSDAAVGKTANCKCGKKFRLGKVKSKKPVAKASAAAGVAKPSKVRRSAPVTSIAEANDDFWDDEISTDLKLASEPKEAAASGAKNVSSAALAAAEAELKAKKGKKVRWGFQWHRVGGGAAMFLGGGVATVFLVLTTGRIFIYLAVITIVGLFTMLSGLMGEEGIWGEDEFD